MMMFESHKYRQAGKIGQDKGRRIPSTGWALVQRHSYDCTCIEWCHVIIINVSCIGWAIPYLIQFNVWIMSKNGSIQYMI